MQQSHPLALEEEEEGEGDGGTSRWEGMHKAHATSNGTSAVGMDAERAPQLHEQEEEEDDEDEFIYPGSSQAPHTTQDQAHMRDRAEEQAESSHDAAQADSAQVNEDEEEEEGFHYPGSTSRASHTASLYSSSSRPATAAREKVPVLVPVPAHFDYARLAQICQSPSSGPGCEPLSALQAFFAQYTSLPVPASPSSSASTAASPTPSPTPSASTSQPAPAPTLATLAEALHPQSGASAVHLAAKSGRADLLAWLLAPPASPAGAPACVDALDAAGSAAEEAPSPSPSSSPSTAYGAGAGAGADPCVRGAGASKGETPLHKAAWEGHVVCVRVLLLAIGRWGRAGARPGAREDQSEAGKAKARAAEGKDEVGEEGESDWGVDATDAEGWTALHSACSRGYLDIVKLLVEPERYLRPASSPSSSSSCSSALYNGKPRSDSDSVSVSPGGSRSASRSASSSSLLPQPPSTLSPISAPPLPRGASIHLPGGGPRGLFTPLMNASAKGHLSLVLYLLHKRRADPFQRNAHGETALDVAAASFEVYLARDVLGREERRRWEHDQELLAGVEGDEVAKVPNPKAAAEREAKGKSAYNPLRLHSTLPVVLHENQRLDTRLPTLLSSSTASTSQHRGASSPSASDPNASSGAGAGAPRWSHQYAARATKRDRRPPGSLPPGGPLPGGLALDLVTGSAPLTLAAASAGSAASPSISSSQNHRGAAAATAAAANMARAVSDPSMLAVFREDVALPTRAEPYKLGLVRGRGREQEQGHGHGGEQGSDAAAELASTPTPASTLLKQKQRAHPPPHPHSRSASDADPSSSSGTNDDDERSEPTHFWLSDWQVDRTHPRVDVQSGWSYATSFDAPDDQWYASPPPALQSLLEGRSGWGARVSRALTGSGPGSGIGDGNGQGAEEQQQPDQLSWVRRRRWVRVMRRRLDLDFDDELARLEAASALGGVAPLINHSGDSNGAPAQGRNGDDAQQDAQAIVDEARRAAREDAGKLGGSAEYVERAAAIAGVRPDAGIPAVASLDEQADLGDDDAGSRANESEGEAQMEELLRRITRLTLAIEEIRGHAFVDQDVVRRGRAEDLLKGYTMQLGQLRRAAKLDLDDEEEDGRDDDDADADDDDEEEEFIYPNSYKDDGASVFTRIAPRHASGAAVLQIRPVVPQRQPSSAHVMGAVSVPSDAGTSAAQLRSADLASAGDFRVPTRDSSHAVVYMSSERPRLVEQNLTPQWQSDSSVKECRACSRKFTFFLRKHHCRRCGHIFCDACTSFRALVPPREMVTDPGQPEMLAMESLSPCRVCAACHAELQLPAHLHNPRGALNFADILAQRQHSYAHNHNHAHAHAHDSGSAALSSAHPARFSSSRRLSSATQDDGSERGGDAASEVQSIASASSRASELTECPVCGKNLVGLVGEAAERQEEHVRQCLERGGGGSVQSGRYLVYKLPSHSPIIGKECAICMEEFEEEAAIARLPCLCFFHRECIDSWLQRGKACPVHAREW